MPSVPTMRNQPEVRRFLTLPAHAWPNSHSSSATSGSERSRCRSFVHRKLSPTESAGRFSRLAVFEALRFFPSYTRLPWTPIHVLCGSIPMSLTYTSSMDLRRGPSRWHSHISHTRTQICIITFKTTLFKLRYMANHNLQYSLSLYSTTRTLI